MKPVTRLLVTILFGWAGIHHFIDHKIGLGILYLLTFGLFGIGWVVDIIRAIIQVCASSPKPVDPLELYIAGVSYYHDNIYRLATENPAYSKSAEDLISNGNAGKRIFQYWFANSPVVLVPEPNNPHDKNAIVVMIAGEKVGYVSHDETDTVRSFLASGHPYEITAFISGGPYKVVSLDGNVQCLENNLHVYVTLSSL